MISLESIFENPNLPSHFDTTKGYSILDWYWARANCFSKNSNLEEKENCKKIFKWANNSIKKIKPTHPGPVSRLLWQKKLGRLMEEQEKLSDQE